MVRFRSNQYSFLVQHIRRSFHSSNSNNNSSGGWQWLWKKQQGRRGAAAAAPAAPPPPPPLPTRQSSSLITLAGGAVTVSDPYAWADAAGGPNCDAAVADAVARAVGAERWYHRARAQAWAPTARALLADIRAHAATAAASSDDNNNNTAPPPERCGEWLYWRGPEPADGRAPALLRRHAATGRVETVLSADAVAADAAALSRRFGFQITGTEPRSVKLSRDGALLAYTLPHNDASDVCCCVTRNVAAGALLDAGAVPVADSVEWGDDGSGGGGSWLLYTAPDAAGRPSQVWRRVLARGPAGDELLFEERDPTFFVSLARTKDWAYLVINSHSKLASEVRLVGARDIDARPQRVARRRAGVEYFVEAWRGRLLVLSNRGDGDGDGGSDGGGDYTLFECQESIEQGNSSSNQDSSAAWRALVPAREGASVTDIDAFAAAVVLHETRAARPALTLVRPADGGSSGGGDVAVQRVDAPPWALALAPGANQDAEAPMFRCELSSPAHAPAAYELSLADGRWARVGGPDHDATTIPTNSSSGSKLEWFTSRDGYEWARAWVPSHDSTLVPLTLMRRSSTSTSTSSSSEPLPPALVHVYGAYGSVFDTDHDPSRLALLDRGWLVAIAHVRGGGELGRRWHAAGRGALKRNSADDLAACARWLADEGLADARRVAVHAASAGCVAAVGALNARPDLFAAAVLEAPFVDLVGAAAAAAVTEADAESVGDGNGHASHRLLAAHERDEWGDAQDAAAARALVAACPYTGIQQQLYPPVLVLAGAEDARAPWTAALKYAARLRAAAGPPAAAMLTAPGGGSSRRAAPARGEVFLRLEPDAGHFSLGLGSRDASEIAAVYAFLVAALQTG